MGEILDIISGGSTRQIRDTKGTCDQAQASVMPWAGLAPEGQEPSG